MSEIGKPTVPPNNFPVDEAWLARRQEEILEPDLPIVDPHVHLWDRGHRYFVEEALADMKGHNVRASVYIECRTMYRVAGPAEMRYVGETEYANGLAAMSASGVYGPARLNAAIVGTLDFRVDPDLVQQVLEAHIKAGGDRFRGIRQSTTWRDDAPGPANRTKEMMMTPAFRAGFARLGKLGLSYDSYLHFPQLPELADLAGKFPDTTIISDHIGGLLGVGPYANRDEVFAAWSLNVRELAKRPNVYMKLGGLGMPDCGFGFRPRPVPPSSQEMADAWRPYFETCIEAFGAGRCMFESNFPPDKYSTSYALIWNAFKRVAGRYSEAEKTALFSGAACKAYRISI